MFVLIFVNFKTRALSREPSSDRVMPRVRARAQASHGNITVLSHLQSVASNWGYIQLGYIGRSREYPGWVLATWGCRINGACMPSKCCKLRIKNLIIGT